MNWRIDLIDLVHTGRLFGSIMGPTYYGPQKYVTPDLTYESERELDQYGKGVSDGMEK